MTEMMIQVEDSASSTSRDSGTGGAETENSALSLEEDAVVTPADTSLESLLDDGMSCASPHSEDGEEWEETSLCAWEVSVVSCVLTDFGFRMTMERAMEDVDRTNNRKEPPYVPMTEDVWCVSSTKLIREESLGEDEEKSAAETDFGSLPGMGVYEMIQSRTCQPTKYAKVGDVASDTGRGSGTSLTAVHKSGVDYAIVADTDVDRTVLMCVNSVANYSAEEVGVPPAGNSTDDLVSWEQSGGVWPVTAIVNTSVEATAFSVLPTLVSPWDGGSPTVLGTSDIKEEMARVVTEVVGSVTWEALWQGERAGTIVEKQVRSNPLQKIARRVKM